MSGGQEFSDAELRSLTLLSPQVSGSSELRFLQNCILYYREWSLAHSERLARGAVPQSQALVLVFAPAPRVETGLEACNFAFSRTWRRSCSLGSGLAVCNENFETILTVENPPFNDADSALDFVSNTLRSDQVFAVVFPAQRRVLVHEVGIDIADWCQDPHEVRVVVEDVEITPDSIASELEIFHDQHTRLPGGITARLMWKTKDGAVGLDVSPELRVQSSLLTYFRGCYRSANAFVDEEIKNPGGRVDVRIQRSSQLEKGKSVTTMLELKVLSPTRTQDWNLDWAMKSIDQAESYRTLDTDACFACIYDARKDKTDSMPTLAVRAAEENVKLYKFPMTPPDSVPKVKKTPSTSKRAK